MTTNENKKKPKILILFCGGTIVMKSSDGITNETVDKKEAIKIMLNLEPKLKEDIEKDISYIDNIDSANIYPHHWDRIAEIIHQKYDDYDGFVITHGTNSMAYTSSALSYALQDLGKPVVLTGAQIPGYKVETDARRNFVNACRVATMDIAGVMIVFDEEIIMGSRASKVSESKLDAFETINWDLLGEIRIDVRLSTWRQRRDHSKQLVLKKGFDYNILALFVLPQMPIHLLEKSLSQNVHGIVLSGYGPGDIPYDFLPFLKKCKNKKIPVVITNQCMEGATLMLTNDVGRQALQAGAIQAYDMSIESVTTKLMWALKHYPYEKIEEIMHTNFTGEINKEGIIY